MKCLICEKPVEVLMGEDFLEPHCMIHEAAWLEIDPGYGSRYDTVLEGKRWFGCICDDCIEKKNHLIEAWERITTHKWSKH